MEVISGFGPERSSRSSDLSAKRLQILKTAVPSLSRVALLVNPKARSTTENDIKQYGEAAKLIGVAVQGAGGSSP